jgi:hypothetical protein
MSSVSIRAYRVVIALLALPAVSGLEQQSGGEHMCCEGDKYAAELKQTIASLVLRQARATKGNFVN